VIRYAILGAGAIGHVMAKTVTMMNQAGNNGVKLCAIASRDVKRAKEFASLYGIEKACTYEDLYNDKDIDLVYIATPHNFHFEQSKRCLESGKHVLCEKAFTVNAKEARELCKIARERNLLITEAIWPRYQPMRQIINETISSGIAGQPMMLTATLCYSISHNQRLVKPELAGGALLDVGIYSLNFANMIFGDPDEVDAVCVKNMAGVDMSDSITLRYKSGQMAVLNASSMCISDRMGIIYCTKGHIRVENINNPQSIEVYNERYELIKKIPCPPQLTGYEYELIKACEAIEKGQTECEDMPHERTIYMMELMDSIRAQYALKYPFEK